MVDRVVVFPGMLPLDTDILNTNLFGMVGQAFLNAAALGTNTVVAGLACTPTVPASLQVNVGTGSIYALDPIDSSAYGSLGTNSANVMKQGILPAAVTLPITPPGTTGYSQVYLVEAALEDIDTGALVLSYYDSANTALPFSGPNNSGSSNYTIRTCRCVIQTKAGAAAPTGTQTTPTVDVGFVGLYAITVSNATTQITANLITQLASAPFFPALPQIPYGVQGGTYIYAGQDTGTANNYIVTFQAGQPIPSAYGAGMEVEFKALNACTGASVVNVQGLGNVSIRRANGVALSANDINSGQIVHLKYDGTYFQMSNYLGTGANTNSNTVVDIPYVADSGTQNAIVATYSPSIGSYSDGLYLGVKLANTITGACTMNANGLGAKSVFLGDGSNPPYNVFVQGMDLLVVYSTAMGAFQIANTSAGMFYRRPTGNYNIYVNAATGSDTLYDGTASVVGSGTSGPFKTISRAMLAAFSYAPSQFTITIQVAAGTYNEAVATPLYAGPNVIINGASMASVLINAGPSHCVACQGPNVLTVENVTVQNSGNPFGCGFFASNGATLVTSNTFNNQISANVFEGSGGGSVYAGNHTFGGNCGGLFAGQGSGGVVSLGQFGANTYTIATPISVTSGTCIANQGEVSVNFVTPPTFVNASFVNGPKFLATANGVIFCNGLGVNFLPGTVAGSFNTGGQYIP